ncbi:hypothetical protein PENTCL1PPCAC_26457, partial [Pristionchus entomophagus]
SFSDHFATLVTDENVRRIKEMMEKAGMRDEKEVPILTEGPSKDDFIEEIKNEAHRRKFNKMKDMQATEEELELLTSLFHDYVSHPVVDNRYLISYSNYCKVRETCPYQFKPFLSDILFESLRADLKDYLGRVDVKRVIMYCHKRLLVNHNRLLLFNYSRAGQPFLSYEDFTEFLHQEIVPNIPGLQDQLNEFGEPVRLMDSTYYLYFVEKKVQFLLDPLYTQKIRIVDLLATGVMDSLIDQFEADKADDETNRFSIVSCDVLLSAFRGCDEDTNGLLSYEELLQYNEGKYSPLFISKVFLTEKTFDDQQIDFTGFLNFYNAVENKKLIQSMRWIFRVLDDESKGYLTRKDISEYADSLMKVVQIHIPSIEAKVDDMVDEVFDICRPVDPTRITIKDVIECGKGATVLGMLTNLDDYHAYETREDQSADPDQ